MQERKLCNETRKFLYWFDQEKISNPISEHLGYVKSDKCSEPSGEHFNLPGHKLSDMEGMVLEQVRNNNPYILRAREELMIQKFDSFKFGLNKER